MHLARTHTIIQPHTLRPRRKIFTNLGKIFRFNNHSLFIGAVRAASLATRSLATAGNRNGGATINSISDEMNVLSVNGLEVRVNGTIWYEPEYENLGKLIKTKGQDYVIELLNPAVNAATRWQGECSSF